MIDNKNRQAIAVDAAWAGDQPKMPAIGGDGYEYSIGQIAHEFSITLRALRFYQSKGLLAPHRQGLTRLYSGQDRERVALILQGIRLGFTLAEIRDMIGARERRGGNTLPVSREKCVEQIGLLERRRGETERAIAELRQIYTDMLTPAADKAVSPRGAACGHPRAFPGESLPRT